MQDVANKIVLVYIIINSSLLFMTVDGVHLMTKQAKRYDHHNGMTVILKMIRL